MEITCQILEPNTYLVCLDGELTQYTAESVQEIFQTLVDMKVSQVIVDMANVPIADRHGIATLLYGLDLFGGHMANFRLMSVELQPRLMLITARLDQLFLVDDSWLMLDEELLLN